MEADGFPLNESTVSLTPLHHATGPLTVIEGYITDFMPDDDAVVEFKRMLSDHGHVLSFVVGRCEKSRMADGTARFALSLTPGHTLPPRRMTIKHSDQEQDVTVFVTARRGTQLCHYCRSTDHARSQCKKAPQCDNCGASTHHALHCKRIRAFATLPTRAAPARQPDIVPGLPASAADTTPLSTAPRHKRKRRTATATAEPQMSAQPELTLSSNPFALLAQTAQNSVEESPDAEPAPQKEADARELPDESASGKSSLPKDQPEAPHSSSTSRSQAQAQSSPQGPLPASTSKQPAVSAGSNEMDQDA
ncbi:hypothetical protein ACM66B_001675 [Microbotryomycetes sp. NB124-2]